MDPKKLQAFAKQPPGGGGPLPGKKAPPFGGGKPGGGKGGPPPFAKKGEKGDEEKGGKSDEQMAAEAAEKVANGDDEQAVELAAGYDPDEDGNPPATVADEKTWNRAKEAVGPEEDSDYDDYWAVVMSTYLSMGGEVKEGGGDEGGDDEGDEGEEE
jgi:hypothetical protein